MKRKMLLVLLFLLATGAVVGICETTLAQPQSGGTLMVGLLSEPSVLDSCSGAWNTGPVTGNLFNSLLGANDQLEIVPGLAESWSMDYKTKTYTFNLRKNVKWHDGKPFTAQDVKFSLEELLPKYSFLGVFLKGSKVDIVSETKVVVKPAIWAPGIQQGRFASTDWSMYPKHILEGVELPKSNYRKAPIGTGPFKFKEWVRGSHITLVRNENYWKSDKPYLDKIIIKIIRDPSSLLMALTTGDVDFVYRGLPFEAYQTLKKNHSLQIILSYLPNYKVFLVNNLKHPVLSNLTVRKAMMHAINKKDLTAKATSNVCRVSNRMFAPEILPDNPNVAVYEYNPKKAEELLDQAGYSRKDDGTRFAIQILVRAGETDEEKTADLLKDYYKAVGIDLTIKKVDFSTNMQLTSNYQFEMATTKKSIVPFFNYRQHHSKNIRKGMFFGNTSQFSNAKVDQYYDQWAFRATTDVERNKAILNAETILTEELPEAPIFDIAWMYAWNNRVGNAFVPARNSIQNETYENVYIKK